MIGQTVSHYRILEKLGEGGMGVVYKAEDMKLKRVVALKFLPQHLAATEEERARFLQEAQAAATLNHPNICSIHALDEHEGQQLIDMEFVDGVTLRKKVEQKPLKVSDAIAYAIQIADALQEAHSKGIVHRDIKADNVMVNSKNQIKVMDFGLAKLKGTLKLTRTSSTVGTLAYMPPEQIQGGEVDARSDIFSAGVLIYEMMTGRLPFRGDHEAAMMYSILNEEPEQLDKFLAEVSPELNHIVNRALEKDPEDRYQTAHDMLIDLRRLKKESTRISRTILRDIPSRGSKPEAVPQSPEPSPTAAKADAPPLPPKKGTRYVIVGGIVLAAAVVSVAAYYLFMRETDRGDRIPVAVTDFVNQTKEEELDGLSGMLITSLEQSRRLAVLTRSRMFDVLKLMGKANVDRIDEALGREICRQAKINALVVASIQKFDKLYIIDLKVLDPIKNEYLVTAKEEGEGKAAIPGMIDRLSEKTRVGLNERISEVQASKQKVADVTTTNLEAYQHYFEGEQLINKLEFEKAAEQFSQAVAIDTTFALAYHRLAYALSWSGRPGAREAIEKAMRNIDKVPEKERYLMRGEYAIIQQDVQQGLSIYKDLLNVYPDEKEAIYLIGDYSFHQQDYPTAAAHLERVLSMDPGFERAYQHLCWTYGATMQFDRKMEVASQYVAKVPDEESYELLADAYLNQAKFDSALQVFSRALVLFPNSTRMIRGTGYTYLFENDFAKAETEFSKLIQPGRPADDQRTGYTGLSELAIQRGKYHEAIGILNRIIDIDLKQNNKSSLGASYAVKALLLKELLGDTVNAHMELQRSLELRDAGDIIYYSWLYSANLVLGEFEKAREIGKTRLSVIIPKTNYEVDGFAGLNAGNYASAITNFKALEPVLVHPDLYALAQCYVAAGQLDNAIEALQRLQRSYSILFDFSGNRVRFLPKSYHLLGKVYEKKGDKKRAIESYQTLLILWKDADRDIPEFVDAKARLARLKGTASK